VAGEHIGVQVSIEAKEDDSITKALIEFFRQGVSVGTWKYSQKTGLTAIYLLGIFYGPGEALTILPRHDWVRITN